MLRALSVDDVTPFFGTGTALSGSAGRCSHFLGTRGPAVTIDTACSSSLVAVHLGVQSLRLGETDLVLCGGVNVVTSIASWIALSRAHMLAPDGKSKTFDVTANGYGRGEGCGIVVLKRLSDAVADRDRIYAVIHGSAVNQDGASSSLTAPSGQAQHALLKAAWRNAKVSAQDIVCVEAHGSGTILGDGVELEALDRALGKVGDEVYVGSVKTNVGHLESAAGVAGLMKGVLALYHREIPAHLHVTRKNPAFPWAQSRIVLPVGSTPWPRRGSAGVSSFGFTGTNAHVVLGEAPAVLRDTTEARTAVLAISAATRPALQNLARTYADLLDDATDFHAIAAASLSSRTHLAERLAVVANDKDAAVRRLRGYVQGDEVRDVYAGSREHEALAPVCLLFPDVGVQFTGMCAEPYQLDPCFRDDIDHCADIFRDLRKSELCDLLFKEELGQSSLRLRGNARAALLAVGWAQARWCERLGIHPEVLIGCGFGVLTAAVVSEAISMQDAMNLACAAPVAPADCFRPFKHTIISAATGSQLSTEDLSRISWLGDEPQALRLEDAVGRACELGVGVFIEAAPRSTLASRGRQASSGSEAVWLPMANPNDPMMTTLARLVADLYARGDELRWGGFAGRGAPERLALYPFERRKFWFSSARRRD
jgi:acyl transferase domain-containing protein